VLDDLDDDDDIFDPQLLDPAQWRDDDDVAVPDDPVTLDGDPDDLATEDTDADRTDDEIGPATESLLLDDDLDDLEATDQVEPVIVPWAPVVELVAGGASRKVDALVQPAFGRSVWEAPDTASDAPDVDVVLRVEGLAVPVRLRRAVGDRERILLGRDVLAGRFLLRL
jgi:hypothetical protein